MDIQPMTQENSLTGAQLAVAVNEEGGGPVRVENAPDVDRSNEDHQIDPGFLPAQIPNTEMEGEVSTDLREQQQLSCPGEKLFGHSDFDAIVDSKPQDQAHVVSFKETCPRSEQGCLPDLVVMNEVDKKLSNIDAELSRIQRQRDEAWIVLEVSGEAGDLETAAEVTKTIRTLGDVISDLSNLIAKVGAVRRNLTEIDDILPKKSDPRLMELSRVIFDKFLQIIIRQEKLAKVTEDLSEDMSTKVGVLARRISWRVFLLNKFHEIEIVKAKIAKARNSPEAPQIPNAATTTRKKITTKRETMTQEQQPPIPREEMPSQSDNGAIPDPKPLQGEAQVVPVKPCSTTGQKIEVGEKSEKPLSIDDPSVPTEVAVSSNMDDNNNTNCNEIDKELEEPKEKSDSSIPVETLSFALNVDEKSKADETGELEVPLGNVEPLIPIEAPSSLDDNGNPNVDAKEPQDVGEEEILQDTGSETEVTVDKMNKRLSDMYAFLSFIRRRHEVSWRKVNGSMGEVETSAEIINAIQITNEANLDFSDLITKVDFLLRKLEEFDVPNFDLPESKKDFRFLNISIRRKELSIESERLNRDLSKMMDLLASRMKYLESLLVQRRIIEGFSESESTTNRKTKKSSKQKKTKKKKLASSSSASPTEVVATSTGPKKRGRVSRFFRSIFCCCCSDEEEVPSVPEPVHTT